MLDVRSCTVVIYVMCATKTNSGTSTKPDKEMILILKVK